MSLISISTVRGADAVAEVVSSPQAASATAATAIDAGTPDRAGVKVRLIFGQRVPASRFPDLGP